ncbi:MAG: hypothetical protein HQ519_09275 [Planctomycetes bacterium]|nr:hypothetical protein [Planctomycetota bacterium]
MPQIWVHFLLKTTLLLALLPVASCAQTTSQADVVEFESVGISYEPLQGIGPETGMLRRDPSDVIKVGGNFYIWYTKVLESSPGYPEGFNGTIWFATSTDGVRWIEQGQALGRGKEHKFDAFGAFTPNILYAPTTNKYYLYYTGVRVEDGKRWDFQRFSGSIDDTVMFYRDQKYWLYYKGHSLAKQLQGSNLPEGTTPMGLAVSDRPDGGFERVPHTSASSFLVQPGHELLLWPYHDGILSLPTGPYRPAHRDDFRLHYSPDGLNFMAVSPVIQSAQQGPNQGPRAPGLYRPDLLLRTPSNTEKVWGISMTNYGPNAGLQRFTLELNKVKSEAGFDGDQ